MSTARAYRARGEHGACGAVPDAGTVALGYTKRADRRRLAKDATRLIVAKDKG